MSRVPEQPPELQPHRSAGVTSDQSQDVELDSSTSMQSVSRGDGHPDRQSTRPVGDVPISELTESRFPCEQCGATLAYRIGSDSLECRHCGHLNRIETVAAVIEELDLHAALRELQTAPTVAAEEARISCPNCAASFSLESHVHAGDCPFCGTTVVTGTGRARPIKPRGLLPFAITASQAKQAYARWLETLWFAPSALKQYARSDEGLAGMYIPYWTYDSDTRTAYAGQRGDVYYVTERYSTVRDGRRVTETRQVPKIRWTPVAGRTARHFDDVLVGATHTLPRKITDWLEPWDLEALVPYQEDWLSGFGSEVYQVDLDEGFIVARKIMDRLIRQDVRHVIGGDQQRITRLATTHSRTTFKHVLLPIWSAGYQYNGKTYRFVVNGRSGKVQGERPWSAWKIGLAVLAGLLALLLFVLLADASGALGSMTMPMQRY